ncbi:TolC family protein [Rhodoferax sp.]|jgi:outer membrane protein TolC|uniref:TolC family protein n=1 Tax=Rhodoferax sp. TaxID=50421 RepID=UPI0037833AFC
MKTLHKLAALTGVGAFSLTMVASAVAQTSAAALNAERERTRARIAEVTADVVRESDTSLTLGRSLSPGLQQSLARLDEAATRGKAPFKPGPREGSLVLADGPVVAAPPPKRTERREAPAVDPAKAPLVYTPDFSRQLLSFAQLAGKEVVDLPRYDAADGAAYQPLAPKDETTWGLADIVTEGLLISPVQAQVVANLDVAQAQRSQAVAALFPTLSLRARAGLSKNTPGVDRSMDRDYRDHSIRLTQPVYNPGLTNDVKSADSAQQAALLRQSGSLEQVALSLTVATVNLAAARLTIDFADEQETQLISVLRYLETRAQAGATSQVDLERARTRVLAAKQTRIDQQATYKTSLAELDRLIEQKPMSLRLPYLNQLPALPATRNEIAELVRKNSATIKALEKDVQAQVAVVAATRAKLLPTFSLSAERDIQKNTSTFETPVNVFTRFVGVGEWRVSLGGRELYEIDEAQAELRKRQSKLEEESRKIEQAVESDFAALQSATLRITTAEGEQREAFNVAESVQLQLKSGRMGNLLEALDATDRLFGARNRQIQALKEQYTAQSRLLGQIGLLSGLALAPAKPAQQAKL